MTKEELVKLIQTSLAGGNMNPDLKGKYHEGDIERYVEMAYSQMLSELSDADIHAYYGQMTKTLTTEDGSYALPVSKDEDLDLYYVSLPVSLAPIGQKALRVVSRAQDINNPFAIITPDAAGIMNHLVDPYDNTISCYRQGDRIEFSNYDKSITHVQVRAIPSFSDLDDEDEVYLPGGKPKYILDFVFSYYGIVRGTPEDQQNDNSSKVTA